jgi:hypothetical protein
VIEKTNDDPDQGEDHAMIPYLADRDVEINRILPSLSASRTADLGKRNGSPTI